MFLKKYKNQLFNHLQHHFIGFDNLQVEESESKKLLVLSYKNTPFRFVIRVDEEDLNGFDCQYTLFTHGYPFCKYVPQNDFTVFDDILKYFDDWSKTELAAYLAEESQIDLWEQYKKGESLLNIEKIDFGDKTNFGQDERKQIQLAINDLKLLISKQFETSVEEQKLVNERLDYLIESSNRLNRFDWKSLAISTIISISIQLSLDTDKGQQLFNLFKQVFRVMPLLFGGEVHH